MGCVTSSSAKVSPVPQLNTTTSKLPTSKQENSNRIRGDRISLADARQRRENESRERIRRISSLASGEAEKARRSSRSRNSSLASSSYHEGSNLVIKEENADSDNRDSKDSTKQNGSLSNGHVKRILNTKAEIQITPCSDVESDDEVDLEKYFSVQPKTESNSNNKSKNSNITENNSNDLSHSNSLSNQYSDNTIENHANNFIDDVIFKATKKFNQENNINDTENNKKESYSPTKDSPARFSSSNSYTAKTRMISVESLQRQSIDSLVLKNNANDLVGNIMAKALAQVESDKIHLDYSLQSPDNNNALSPQNNLKTQSGSNISTSSSVVRAQAEDLVGSVLNNAMYDLSEDR